MIEHGNSTFDYRSIREVAVNAGAGATAGEFNYIYFALNLSSLDSSRWVLVDG